MIGAIFMVSSVATLTNNHMDSNSASLGGGGIYVEYGTSLNVNGGVSCSRFFWLVRSQNYYVSLKINIILYLHRRS